MSISSLRLGILLDPFGCGGLPLVTTVLPDLSDCHLLRVLRIRCLHDGKDGLNDEFSVESGHPILVDSLRANLTCVRLDARVVDFRDELDLGWLEGIVVREVEINCEFTSDEWCALRSINVDIPDHDIVLCGYNLDAIDRCTCKVTQFLLSDKERPMNYYLVNQKECFFKHGSRTYQNG